MYLCRAAWQKLAPVARNSGTAALLRNAPARQMSSSSVPGSSGSSLPYTIFVCASLTAGGLYVYHTLTRDQARFQDRHEYIRSRPKPETAAKPWPPQGSGEAESSDVSEAPEEAAVTAEAVAIAVEEIEVQETIPTALLIEEDTFPEEVPIATEPAAQLEAIPPQGEEVDSSNISKTTEETAVTPQAVEDIQELDAIPTALLENILLEETEVPIATESVAVLEAVSVQGQETRSNVFQTTDDVAAVVPSEDAAVTAEETDSQNTVPSDHLNWEILEEEVAPVSAEPLAQLETVPVPGEEVETIDMSEAAEEVLVKTEAVAVAAEEIEEQHTVLSAPVLMNETLQVQVSTESAVGLENSPVQGEEAESSNVATEEVIVAVTVEAIAAEESEIQDTIHAAPLVTEEMLEDVAVSEEPTTELQTAPVSEQNTGTMAAASAEESSPVLEETSGNIQEELAAAAADDWSELSSHKPEEAGEEAVQATTESLEVAQTEEVSASS
ncbi:protein MGARP isoform X3 [Xenopus tropicalis]|uniref:Protein MGARP isoform X3 n=1 Tax=Xenopus tropicalis TaxID=8364 RepID=A0A8J1J0L2_XENTR|nr:protein MGARP isoform X3 [Xenopus tropicalis]